MLFFTTERRLNFLLHTNTKLKRRAEMMRSHNRTPFVMAMIFAFIAIILLVTGPKLSVETTEIAPGVFIKKIKVIRHQLPIIRLEKSSEP